MLKILRLALPLWLRECKRGQWTILLLSLVLAVTAISSMQFVTERIKAGLSEQSAKLLGGNLVITSSQPLPVLWSDKAREFHLNYATTIDMQTMVSQQDKLVLVNIQAVSDHYPVLEKPLNIPPRQAIVDQRLLNTLNTTLPVNIKIGVTKFTSNALLPADLELNTSSWLIAPRVLIRLDDLASTQTLLPGSRANYRLLVAGLPEDIASFRRYIEPLLTIQQRLTDTEHQRFSLLNNVSQIEQYLQLIVLFCLFMCGVAISLSVRQYVKRHHQDIALWRCLGASAQQIRHLYLLLLVFAAIVSGITGIVIGYFIHLKMIAYLANFFPFAFPTPGWQPYVQGLLTSVVMLFCFAYPILYPLPQVKPLSLWRDETANNQTKNPYPLAALCIFIIFTCWLLHFTLSALFIIACILLFIAVGLFLLDGLFASIRYFLTYTTGAIRRGLSQLIQFPESSGIQIGAFTLVITLMIILQLMKGHLLDKWQDAIAAQAPNYFAFNIAPEDIKVLTNLLSTQQLHATAFFPMIKGRLVTVNRQPVLSVSRPGNNHNALHRDLNLSSGLNYPTDNRLVTGRAWNNSDIGKSEVSVESSLANALQLKIGDELGFMIDGKSVTATVSNIRTVNWASFNPNFYIIFPPDTLVDAPTTYVISFYLPSDKTAVLNQMIDAAPNMTIIDMADTLKKIQNWIQQATTAIQGLFLFTLLASVIIFIAALLTTMDERRKTYQLIHVLGGTRSYIIKSILIEMVSLFVVTIVISYSAASLIFYALIHTVY